MFQGAGEIIPGGATLFFDIEVMTFLDFFKKIKAEFFKREIQFTLFF